VFITIDDGIVRSKDALKWVQRRRLPVTSFLTTSVADGHYGYFTKISARGSLQNHTVSHPAFDTFGGDLRTQICPVQQRLAERTGTRPWLLRPPYGAGARLSRVHLAAASCGISHIVMWDAVVDRGRLTTWNGQQLSRGSIILLHYGPNLKAELRLAVNSARAQGLQVAALEDYLRKP
jgi:peptidoglycan/xylan/chitin deacetylase (PgdA/CDA1 family)